MWPCHSNGGKSICGTCSLRKHRKSQQKSRKRWKIKAGSEGQYRREVSKKGARYLRFAMTLICQFQFLWDILDRIFFKVNVSEESS